MIPDINLLQKVDKRQSNSRNLYILLSIIVLLLIVFFVMKYFKIRAEITSLRAEEESVMAQRDQLQVELDTMTTNTGSLKESVEFVELISYPVSPIINETIRLQPEPSYLREYVFDAKTAIVTIDFETLSQISNYLSKLVSSPYFEDVQVTSIEHFDIKPTSEEEENQIDFHEIPRYKAEFSLFINPNYLATGGNHS